MTDKSKRLNAFLTVFIVLLFVFIWGNSALSVEKSDGLSRWVLEHIFKANSGDVNFNQGDHILRKAAHVTEFMLLAASITLRLRSRRHFWMYGFLGVLAAAADETIQIFSHRGSQVKDVGIDSIGVVIGTLIIFLIVKHKKSRRQS